jgi:protein-S-isoprenylcysteine O-methyltransferase Ste14
MMYGVLHSLFAANWMKGLFLKYSGEWYKYYRLIYTFLATIMLVPILWYQSTLPQKLLFHQQAITVFVGLVLATFGIMAIKISFGHYDLKEFLGMQQLRNHQQSPSMITHGVLSVVRHPLYSGSILAILGYLIFAPTLTNLVMALCLILYFMVGIHFEEKKLVLEFGAQYLEYQQQVPSLIPGWKFFFRNHKNPKKD